MSPAEVFVLGLWTNVPSEDDVSWVRRVAALPRTEEPLGDYGVLVKRMLECGMSEYEIARFAKIVGYETAFGTAYYLGDPSVGFLANSNPERVSWALYHIDDETKQPLRELTCLHELLLSMDPTGREMRPKGGEGDEAKT